MNDVFIIDHTIFSSWTIASSPFVLGFDLTNKTTVDRLWPIITNDTLVVNQNWSGHPGRQIAYANYTYSDLSETDPTAKKGI